MSEKELKKWKKIYGIVGKHSAIEICSWTKKALRGEGICYKQKFYGVDCHRCAQISPAFAWCHENCIFCWRPNEWMKEIEMDKNQVDQPEYLIEGFVSKRRELISGFKGYKKTDKEKFKESYYLFPSHWAISLSGEPTLYPLLPELILELKKRKEVKSIFVVSNGQEPERIERMKLINALPTQLYISVDACDKKMFEKINKPKIKDGWERLLKTLSLLKNLNCRTVIRFTLIKNVNDQKKYIKEFANLFEFAYPDFIEIKSYMHLGASRKRLKRENMLEHSEVKEYAINLIKEMKSYEIVDEDEASKIVLLKRRDSKYKNIIENP